MTVFRFLTRGRDGRPVKVVADGQGWRCSCGTEDGQLGPCAVLPGLRWPLIRVRDPATGEVRARRIAILVELHTTRAQRRAAGETGRGLPGVGVVFRDGGEPSVPDLPNRSEVRRSLLAAARAAQVEGPPPLPRTAEEHHAQERKGDAQ